MVDVLKKILIVFAGTIIVLHSMIPHHHDNNTVEKSEYSTSIFDYISLALQIDLGKNHLENFVFANDFCEENTDFLPFTFLITDTIYLKTPYFKSSGIVFNTKTPSLFSENNMFLYQFRGPPFFNSNKQS